MVKTKNQAPGTKNSDRAFSLIELMVVMAILALVAVFAVPAVNSTLVAYRLTTGAESAVGQIASARQSAIALNRTVEVRFYRYALQGEPGEQPATPSTGKFRAFQVYQYDDTGLASPLTSVEKLPDGIIFDSGKYSSLLSSVTPKTFKPPLDAQVPLPACGTAYTCVAYQVMPAGNTTLPAGQWFVTIHKQTDGDSPASPPPNYVTIQIDPASGAARTHRP